MVCLGRSSDTTRHTHIHIVLYFTLYVYTVREVSTYSKHSIQKEHVLVTAGNQSLVHSFADATRRDRDWRRSSDDETGERTERTNERVRRRRRRLRRDATASRTRARLIGVGKIHSLAERVTEKSTREDSFIHSFIRFGDASGRRNDPAESLDRVDVDGLVRDAAVDA